MGTHKNMKVSQSQPSCKALLILFFIMTALFPRSLVQGLASPVHKKRLVLVGGGHAHAQVIKAMKNHRSFDVTVIDMNPSASYSGMVPGCVARIYTPDQTKLHLIPLCQWAGVDFVQDEVVDMDFEKNCIYLRGKMNRPISYDVVSMDIGSATRCLETPGAREFTIPTRPISSLVERIDHAEETLEDKTHVVVVGAGAAGIELALSMRVRWNEKTNLTVTLLDAGNELLPSETPACREALKDILQERCISIMHDCHVTRITDNNIQLGNGDTLPYTHCLWATGAAAHTFAETLKERGLGVSDRGWIRVNDNFQSVSHPSIFAAGDCCTIEGLKGPSPPKAGVYAVRSGPVLLGNLVRFLEANDEALEGYRPQDDFLKLINCGDGTALGFRFGVPFQGKWVFEMKDHIDQLFMNMFREEYLPEDDSEAETTQFDTLDEDKSRTRLSPVDAGALLQRKDDDVDYMLAWHVIRDMAKDEEYRSAIVDEIEQKVLTN